MTTESTARAAFGHGLALAPVDGRPTAYDLVWVRGPAGGPGLVEGVDNLAQDLTLALLTPVGSDPFDTGFGFDGLTVLTLPIGHALGAQLLQVSVVHTLLADGRVAAVNDVQLKPIDEQRHQVVRASVRTVLGNEVPLTLGEVLAR